MVWMRLEGWDLNITKLFSAAWCGSLFHLKNFVILIFRTWKFEFSEWIPWHFCTRWVWMKPWHWHERSGWHLLSLYGTVGFLDSCRHCAFKDHRNCMKKYDITDGNCNKDKDASEICWDTSWSMGTDDNECYGIGLDLHLRQTLQSQQHSSHCHSWSRRMRSGWKDQSPVWVAPSGCGTAPPWSWGPWSGTPPRSPSSRRLAAASCLPPM